MKIECVNAVQSAIGRELSQAERTNIEERVRSTMRRLASSDPQRWGAMPLAERVREAGRVIAEDVQHGADLKDARIALQVEAHARHLPNIEAAGSRGFEAIQRKLEQADRYIKGVHREALRQTLDAIDFATTNDTGSLVSRGLRWVSNLENPEKTLAFAREVFGKDSGDVGAKGAAKAWSAAIDALRERFNRAGGDVRKLSYGYLPQPHDTMRMTSAGIDVWTKDVLRLVDRRRYTDERGRQLNDGELAKVLERTWREITSDGLVSAELGAYRGEGSLANAGSQARALHFKDGDAHVAYLGAYGKGTLFDAMSDHLRWMARNIALTEEFGPNPAATYRTMHDTARLGGGKDRVAGLTTTEDMWGTLTGKFDNPHSQTLANIWQGVRNIEVAGKLQQTTIGAITDVPLYMVTLGYNRLPFWQGITTLVRSFGGEARSFADVAGLMGESVIGDMHRWGEGHIGRGWTDRLANATMKLSLLNAWTDAVRRAMSISMMGGMARMARTPWESLNKHDRARLETAGWTADEFAVLANVAPERWRESDMLTPAAVMRAEGVDLALRERVVSRMLGTIVDETEFASPNPDLRTRTLQAGGLQRGTGNGELWRSIMLFKGFGFTQLFRHWNRAIKGDMSPAGRLAYGSALAFGTTLFGSLANELYDIVAGRDPRDATGDQGNDKARLARYWTAAVARGGGFGFLGDMLLSGQGSHGQSGASAAIGGVTGPVIGSAFELAYDVGLENLREAAEGKDTHAGAEAFRWARGHTPFVNLWYLKLAVDQAFLNQAQEFLSPGFLAKTRARMEKQWSSQWWWQPSDTGLISGDMTLPERGPNFGEMVGQ